VVKFEVKDAENVVENQKSASVEAAEKTGKQA
jgi:hypothetical protein